MKPPERLFSSDPDLVHLHEVLDRDGPPAGASERALGRVLADAVVDRASPAPREAPPSPSIKPWLAVGIGATVLVAGMLVWSWRQAPGANPAPLASAEPMAAPERNPSVPPHQATAPSAEGRPVEPSIHVDDLPTASPAVTAPSPATTADVFLEELRLVERARTALAQGRGRECLEATRSYETKFARGGLFREEVEVMHIEALAMSGERAAARARGQRFLDVHIDTPYLERIRRVLDQAAQ